LVSLEHDPPPPPPTPDNVVDKVKHLLGFIRTWTPPPHTHTHTKGEEWSSRRLYILKLNYFKSRKTKYALFLSISNVNNLMSLMVL
jgi:hypothetical protein